MRSRRSASSRVESLDFRRPTTLPMGSSWSACCGLGWDMVRSSDKSAYHEVGIIVLYLTEPLPGLALVPATTAGGEHFLPERDRQLPSLRTGLRRAHRAGPDRGGRSRLSQELRSCLSQAVLDIVRSCDYRRRQAERALCDRRSRRRRTGALAVSSMARRYDRTASLRRPTRVSRSPRVA